MQEFIEKLTDWLANHHRVVKTDEDAEWNRAIYSCEEIVNQLAEEHNNGWIPCSERLPEEGKAIRVWLSFTNPVASFAKRAWWNDNHFEWDNGQRVKDKPLAWMVSVAPEPYQPKGE